MEREVRYCTTEDGVRIAYCSQGEGPPLIMTGQFVESFSLYHLLPEIDQFLERLLSVRRVVLYDPRGCGLSQRDGTFRPWGADQDLAAVVGASGEQPVALWANGPYAPSAIRIAARHPEAVDRLVLFGPLARISDAYPDAALRSFAELARSNWPLAAQTFGDMSTRQADPAAGLRRGEVNRQSTTGDFLALIFEAVIAEDEDARPDLPNIRVPTLVIHRKEDYNIPLRLGQEIAAAIPDARFVPVDGVISHYAFGDQEAVLRVALPFLRHGEPPTTSDAAASATEPGGVRTVLFSDIVGHTEMMRRMGDEKGREVLREHERITREALKAHGGTEVKTMGDGFMASFASAAGALGCAVALQRAFEERNASLPAHPEPVEGRAEPQPSAHASTSSARADRSVDAEPIRVRIGLNAGEPIAEDEDLFGAAVIRAARIAALAQAGEILVANVVREIAEGKGFLFSDRGEVVLRGFDDPVRLFEVRWAESA
jgi:class 3 adenylate cyclase/pimeloyl-ACP methyl ester carboxylesterase